MRLSFYRRDAEDAEVAQRNLYGFLCVASAISVSQRFGLLR